MRGTCIYVYLLTVHSIVYIGGRPKYFFQRRTWVPPRAYGSVVVPGVPLHSTTPEGLEQMGKSIDVGRVCRLGQVGGGVHYS